MWKQKIGMSVGNRYAIPTEEVVKILAEIGFDAISPEWGEQVDLDAIIRTARQEGMAIQSLHAPFKQSANMWSEDENVSAPALEQMLMSLEACHKHQIPILVVHVWIGFDTDKTPNEHGFRTYAKLVDKATEYGVKIAFENTEGEEFLYALMDYFKENDTVGFCWDSGHEMCYNHSQDLLERYGDRLLVTHLNDNLGISRYDGKTYWTDDLHLLPYDGIADWDDIVERLQKSNRLEYLNFELGLMSKPNRHENDIYQQMPLQQYFVEVYKRACKIAYRYAK